MNKSFFAQNFGILFTVPENALFFAPYFNSINAYFSEASKVASITGSPTVYGGYLEIHATNDQVKYADGFLDGNQQFTLKFTYNPNYNGAPGGSGVNIIGSDGSGGFGLAHMGNGNLGFSVDSPGHNFANISANWLPTAGTDYEIVVYSDGSGSGSHSIYINGSLLVSGSGSGTIGGTGNLQIGSFSSNSFKIKNYQILTGV